MKHEIANAIMSLTKLRVRYDPGERTIEPHALGLSKDRNLLLRAYQTEGASASGEHVNWKLFRVDQLSIVDSDLGAFEGPRPGYRQGDKAMRGGIIREL